SANQLHCHRSHIPSTKDGSPDRNESMPAATETIQYHKTGVLLRADNRAANRAHDRLTSKDRLGEVLDLSLGPFLPDECRSERIGILLDDHEPMSFAIGGDVGITILVCVKGDLHRELIDWAFCRRLAIGVAVRPDLSPDVLFVFLGQIPPHG